MMLALVMLLLACPVTGRGGDPELNRLKNRAEPPPAARTWAGTIPDVLNMRQPTRWHVGARRLNGEAKGVALTGYLVKANAAGKESCNCEDPARVDWHLAVAERADDPLGEAVVCELTPRFGRCGWTLPRLRALVGQRVRVTGWMMLDTEHLDGAQAWRGTAWEVHPVTRVEVRP